MGSDFSVPSLPAGPAAAVSPGLSALPSAAYETGVNRHLELHGAQSGLDCCFIAGIDVMILLEYPLEKAFTIPGDTAGGFPGFHPVGKGEAQIALEIPRKLIVLFLGKRIIDSKSVLWPIIKADRRLKFVLSTSTFLDTYGRHAHVSF